MPYKDLIKRKECYSRYVENHKEELSRYKKEYNKIYKSKNKEQHKITEHKRRAKIKGSGGTFTKEEWDFLKEIYGYKCPCCKKKEPEIILTIDHIIPIHLNGINSIENIQPLCNSCNCKKNTKVIKYDLLDRQGL